MAPYYNVLNPRVQTAMLEVVRGIGRTLRQSSVDGRRWQSQLSANGYAQLPGEAWGFDDDTIARFEQASARRRAGRGPQRFAERARFFAGPGRMAWLVVA